MTRNLTTTIICDAERERSVVWLSLEMHPAFLLPRCMAALTILLVVAVLIISLNSKPESDTTDLFPRALVQQDEAREKLFMSPLSEFEETHLLMLREKLYRMVTLTAQTACVNGVRAVGGNWLECCGAMDGSKHVCLDDIMDAGKPCLIYSFGVGGDISFEETMAEMGCMVRLFDRNTEPPEGTLHPNIAYHKIGIGENKVGDDITLTLGEILEKLGDRDRDISYLKMDIEGGELKALKEWIGSGALDRVGQIGIEMHTARSSYWIKEEDTYSTLLQLVRDLQALRGMGFRLVSHEINGCTNRVRKSESENENDEVEQGDKYFSFFEVVFFQPLASRRNS